jgi:hypothetical protein
MIGWRRSSPAGKPGVDERVTTVRQDDPVSHERLQAGACFA